MVSFEDGLPWLAIGAIAGVSLHWWIEAQSQTAYIDEKGHPIIWIADRYERLDIPAADQSLLREIYKDHAEHAKMMEQIFGPP